MKLRKWLGILSMSLVLVVSGACSDQSSPQKNITYFGEVTGSIELVILASEEYYYKDQEKEVKEQLRMFLETNKGRIEIVQINTIYDGKFLLSVEIYYRDITS